MNVEVDSDDYQHAYGVPMDSSLVFRRAISGLYIKDMPQSLLGQY